MKKVVTITIDPEKLSLLDDLRGIIPRSALLEKFFDKYLTLEIGKKLIEEANHESKSRNTIP